MSNYPGPLSGGFVSHRFQSLKADEPDPSLVNPSNWNQSHIIGSGAIQSGALGGAIVGSGNVQSGAILVGALASGAVASGMLGSGAILYGNLASGAVTSGVYVIGSGAIQSGMMASGSVLWNPNLAGKPFVLVTPNGPTDGGDYGPNTIGTVTWGIQEALDSTSGTTNQPTVHVAAGKYPNMNANFSGITIRSNYVAGALIYDPDAYIPIATGYSSGVHIWDGTSAAVNDFVVQGGYFIEKFNTQYKWHLHHFKAKATGGISFCKIHDQFVEGGKTMLYFDFQDASGYVNANTFENMRWDDMNGVFEAIQPGAAALFQGNIFRRIQGESTAQLTTAFKNIRGKRNAFEDCWVWDITGSQITANIASDASSVDIMGGNLDALNFSDSGSNTSIRQPVDYASNFISGASGTVTLASVTAPSIDAFYEVGCYLHTTAYSSGNLYPVVNWKDETNTTLNQEYLWGIDPTNGSATVKNTITASGIYLVSFQVPLWVKAGSSISVQALIGAGAGLTYNARGFIKRSHI